MLCDDLEGWDVGCLGGVQEGGDIGILYSWLTLLYSETNRTLQSSYTPISKNVYSLIVEYS